MKYKNANKVLPLELLEQIQKYVQGEYIYIPIKNKGEVKTITDYTTELEKRNTHIYIKYLEGLGNKQLADMYNLSQSSIRRIIIKQRKGYILMKDKIKDILFHWGLENGTIKQIYDTTWQVGDSYVLKAYDNLEMLERNLKILHILEEMDIPVGQVVLTHGKYSYVEKDGTFFFLSKKLEGNNIVQIKNVSNIALMMGEIIADLHTAFQKCESAGGVWNNSLLDEMNGWVKDNFENSDWKYIDRTAYEEVITRLTAVYDKLPVQLIHRDVHFGNFLFADGRFSGYIDFDLSQRNIRIFDICYFLLGLLPEEEKYNITEEQWFVFVKNVFIGYERKLKLSETEKKAVPCVMECIELLFVSWFESVNDLSCAEDAFKIFGFVQKQEERIWREIR